MRRHLCVSKKPLTLLMGFSMAIMIMVPNSIHLLELKQMQENDSSMQIQFNTHFVEELPEFGSKQGKYQICQFYIHMPHLHCSEYSLY